MEAEAGWRRWARRPADPATSRSTRDTGSSGDESNGDTSEDETGGLEAEHGQSAEEGRDETKADINLSPQEDENEYERERRVRTETNQAELQQLELDKPLVERLSDAMLAQPPIPPLGIFDADTTAAVDEARLVPDDGDDSHGSEGPAAARGPVAHGGDDSAGAAGAPLVDATSIEIAEPWSAGVVDSRRMQPGRGAKWAAASGAAAESASNDLDEEWSSDRAGEQEGEEWISMARPRKAARRAGRAAVRGPGAEEAAAGPAGAPRGRWSGAWEAQLARLAAYKEAHGDCNVPKSWAEDPPLGRWVHHAAGVQEEARPRRPQPGDHGGAGGEAGGAVTFDWAPGCGNCGGASLTQEVQPGRRSSPGWRRTRRRTATATCRSGLGRGPAAAPPGSTDQRHAQEEAGPRRPQPGDHGGAGGEAGGAGLCLGAVERTAQQETAGGRDERGGMGGAARPARGLQDRRTATATCRRAGPRTRGWAGGSSDQRAGKKKLDRGEPGPEPGDHGGAGGEAGGAGPCLVRLQRRCNSEMTCCVCRRSLKCIFGFCAMNRVDIQYSGYTSTRPSSIICYTRS